MPEPSMGIEFQSRNLLPGKLNFTDPGSGDVWKFGLPLSCETLGHATQDPWNPWEYLPTWMVDVYGILYVDNPYMKSWNMCFFATFFIILWIPEFFKTSRTVLQWLKGGVVTGTFTFEQTWTKKCCFKWDMLQLDDEDEDEDLTMGVFQSKNSGTPKWMVTKGNPIKIGWFGGKPTIFGNIPSVTLAIIIKCLFGGRICSFAPGLSRWSGQHLDQSAPWVKWPQDAWAKYRCWLVFRTSHIPCILRFPRLRNIEVKGLLVYVNTLGFHHH